MSDSLGRRTQVTYSGTAFNVPPDPSIVQPFGYNDRNELTTSSRPGQNWIYGYDPIGNRTTATDGDVGRTYESNNLNEYTHVNASGAIAAALFPEYDDDGNLIKTGIAADMDCDGDVDFDDIGCFIEALSDGCPPNPPGYSCPDCDCRRADVDGDGDVDFDDADIFGDLLGGAVATAYTWDAENRLIAVGPTDLNSAPDGSQRAEFGYDYLSRRVWKKVYTKTSGSWVLTEHRKFVWAGWLLLMELNGTDNAVLRKYTWGLDVAGLNGNQSRDREGAGFLQAAGGIGGLLAVCDTHGTPGTTGDDLNYAYFYDGNGNVGQLADWSVADPAAALVARYEYDPYGGDLLDPNNPSQSGSYAATNVFRFSTRPQDSETGLYQWPRRPYDPRLGRWITRDPIEEPGAETPQIAQHGTVGPSRVAGEAEDPYRYATNHPTGRIDALGLEAVTDQSTSDCCNYCGPNIRAAVDTLLTDVDAKFSQLGAQERRDLCAGYMDAGKWDTDLFTNANAFKTPRCPQGKACGFDNAAPGAKGGMSVTFGGKCYASYDASYVLYGRMMKNCGNAVQALAWFNIYKLKTGTWLRYVQAGMWIDYGRGEIPSPEGPPSNLKKCQPCPDAWRGTVHWFVYGSNGVSIRG